MSEELPVSLTVSGRAATTEDFQELAKQFWKQEEEAKVKAPAKKEAFAVVTPSATGPLLDAFAAAFSAPVLQAVEWPDEVPANHPVRKLPVFVRLWNGQQWTKFWSLNKPDSKDDLIDQFWYVLFISAVNDQGTPLFSAFQPEEALGDYDVTMSQTVAKLKQAYDGPAGLLTMNPIYIAALGFNGLLKTNEERDAKNSDTATSSTSSGE